MILVSLFFPFSTFQMENQLHCSWASLLNGKGNDNEENAEIRDCLEKFKTTSTPTALGADQPALGNGSISDSGIGSYFHRIVLDDYIEFASASRWSTT